MLRQNLQSNIEGVLLKVNTESANKEIQRERERGRERKRERKEGRGGDRGKEKETVECNTRDMSATEAHHFVILNSFYS